MKLSLDFIVIGDKSLSEYVNQDECHAQWRVARVQMIEGKRQGKTTEDFWAEHIQNPQSDFVFADLHRLIRLYLVVVLSSVACERIFSQMNLTKSKARARMLSVLLNDLLMIKMNGPKCDGVSSSAFQDIREISRQSLSNFFEIPWKLLGHFYNTSRTFPK